MIRVPDFNDTSHLCKLTNPDILRSDLGNSVLELGGTECNRRVRARVGHRGRIVCSHVDAQ